MVVVPFHSLIMLLGITFYFKKDYFNEIAQTEAKENLEVLMIMLKSEKERDEMTPEDFYPIAVTGVINKIDKDENVILTTKERVLVDEIEINENNEISVTFAKHDMIRDIDDEECKKRYKKVRSSLLSYVSHYQWGVVARNYIMKWRSLEEMTATLSNQFDVTNEEKYEILSAETLSECYDKMEKLIYGLIELTKVSSEIENEQKKKNEKLYREDALRKQIDILQNELDELHPESQSDIRKFEEKINNSDMNKEARAEATKILNRMKQEGQDGHEYGMLYDYLDFVTSLSWKKEKYREINLSKAEEILDSEHFGLKKAKERIIQQIAVMALNKRQSGSILLFVGPPGTGKTSIGQSVAKALKREYVRVSLGGIRDEAEIRGHRRTYIGAMPGRIMDAIKKSGVSNPVMVLDEVDKLVKAFDGDPSSALLEVLDPEQNNTFTDHYMNVPYDLSDVLFICTANSVDTIPEPLLNRMEVINFQGYTESEKMQIARKHLIPKSMKKMGIKNSNIKITDKALHSVIADYTMEAGVRGLKKQIDNICRTVAVKLVKKEQRSVTVNAKKLKEFLDTKPIKHDVINKENKPGVITGLAWTQAGGDILFIESILTKGEGKVIITGQLGDVMKESVQIAISLVKSMYPDKADVFKENDIHIHVPAGAIPKDGPSAGITLTTAIASLINNCAVKSDIAMTGEVSLQGNVMPIGGLQEKLMAAVRAGVETVYIPVDNKEDLEDIPEEVKDNLTIIPVTKVTEVLELTGIKK